jgi:Anti-sigma regulatory factor (Ser/Thr protein kinase)
VGHAALPLELEIPSDIGYIEEAVAQVIRRCEEAAFSQHHLTFRVPVALTEALSNAILRGNREDLTKSVRVRLIVDAQLLVLEVEDDGTGFDLDACTADPTTPDNLGREDGRGLFLMRRLMDRVEQFRARGNVVRLTLHYRSIDGRAA